MLPIPNKPCPAHLSLEISDAVCLEILLGTFNLRKLYVAYRNIKSKLAEWTNSWAFFAIIITVVSRANLIKYKTSITTH